MLPEISTLAKLEQLDAQTHQLQARLTELPKLLSAEKKQVDDKKKHVELLQTKLNANVKERRTLEDDIQLRQAKLKKLLRSIEKYSMENSRV